MSFPCHSSGFHPLLLPAGSLSWGLCFLFQANSFLLHRYALVVALVLCHIEQMVLLQVTLAVCETTIWLLLSSKWHSSLHGGVKPPSTLVRWHALKQPVFFAMAPLKPGYIYACNGNRLICEFAPKPFEIDCEMMGGGGKVCPSFNGYHNLHHVLTCNIWKKRIHSILPSSNVDYSRETVRGSFVVSVLVCLLMSWRLPPPFPFFFPFISIRNFI